MSLLEKQKYVNVLKNMENIKCKNNELIELHQYLLEFLNSNLLIDDKCVDCDDLNYIYNNIKIINSNIYNNLLVEIQKNIIR